MNYMKNSMHRLSAYARSRKLKAASQSILSEDHIRTLARDDWKAVQSIYNKADAMDDDAQREKYMDRAYRQFDDPEFMDRVFARPDFNEVCRYLYSTQNYDDTAAYLSSKLDEYL